MTNQKSYTCKKRQFPKLRVALAKEKETKYWKDINILAL
jgi:hypothetical protein